MNCFTCGKPIINRHWLDGKVYGYNCYKLALALKYANLTEQKNADYNKKCIAIIETFKNKEFKDQWNKDFKGSILNQWSECQKLTARQLEAITKKFDNKDYVEYNLVYSDLSDSIEVKRHIENFIKNNFYLLDYYMHDERIINIIKIMNKRERHIVKYKDIDDDHHVYRIVSTEKLSEIKNDEYNDVLDVVNL